MIKVKTILNNCISDIISNNRFNRIFVYGSENLELEKLIYNLTSSPIIGGDVDFCNVLLGKYFSNNKDLGLNEEIYKELELDTSSHLADIEKIALAIIYKAYKPKKNNEYNKRIFNNIIKNKNYLCNEIKNQISYISLEINEFKECEVEEFIKDVGNNDLLVVDTQNHTFINEQTVKLLLNSNFTFIVVLKKEIIKLRQNQILNSQNLNVYSNVNMKSKLLSTKTNKQIFQKSFDIVDGEEVENIDIK